MSGSLFTPGGDLDFDHVGTMTCGDRLLLCDVEYFPPRFAGMQRAQVSLGVELEVVPGVWQVLTASEPALESGSGVRERTLRFVLLAHERELEISTPLDQAEAVGLLRVDSGRITAIDPELREDEVMQTALLEAPREQVPCMLRPLDSAPDAEPRGALLDLDAGGVFELYASVGEPRGSLFLAITD